VRKEGATAETGPNVSKTVGKRDGGKKEGPVKKHLLETGRAPIKTKRGTSNEKGE